MSQRSYSMNRPMSRISAERLGEMKAVREAKKKRVFNANSALINED